MYQLTENNACFGFRARVTAYDSMFVSTGLFESST